MAETSPTTIGWSAMNRVQRGIRTIASPSLTQFVLRLALAVPFLKSGWLKWDGVLSLSDTAVYLFTDEFRLHLPGGPYPFPAPMAVAFLTACAETVLPLMLVAGLATRLVASALLIMTAVIQLTIPDGWPVHLTWAAMALAIMAWGPGRIALDTVLPGRPAPPTFTPAASPRRESA